MPEIKVTTEKLRELTAKIITTESLMANLHSNFNKARSNICESTDNSAASNIRMKMSTIHIKMAESCNNMLWIRDMLIKSAEAFEEAERKLQEQIRSKELEKKVGTVVADVCDQNGDVKYPYSKYTAFGRYTFGNEADKLQCVGYAWARYEELTGEDPGIGRIGYAGNLANFVPDSYERVSDYAYIKTPSFGYKEGNPGHIVVIEGSFFDENGECWVYYTEGNHSGAKDGTMNKTLANNFSGIIQKSN